jgi:hypothetical protein
MTPKEKAIQLAKQYYPIVNGGEQPDWVLRKAKECALITVDEILNNDGFTQFDIYLTEYWQEVKQEIEKI